MHLDFRKVKYVKIMIFEMGWYGISPIERTWESHIIHCPVVNTVRSDQSLSCVRLFATPWIAARQASLSITNSRSSPRLTSIKSVMPSNHLILCRPLLLRKKSNCEFYRETWQFGNKQRALNIQVNSIRNLSFYYWAKKHILNPSSQSPLLLQSLTELWKSLLLSL